MLTRARWLTPHNLALLLILGGLVWRTARYLAAWPIWGDEAFVAVDFLVRDYWEMLQPSHYGQIVPLLFMWAELTACHWLGTSELALRLLPYLFGVAALLLYWRFVRRVLPPHAALLPIGFFASAYFTVRHGAEVKPYASDLLVALLFMLPAYQLSRRPGSVWAWVALIGLAAFGGWASYPAIFCAGGVAVYLTVLLWRARNARRLLLPYLVYCVAMLGGFAWVYFTYAKPQADFSARLINTEMWSPTFPPWKQPWMIPIWLVGMHTGLMMAYPFGGQTPGSVGTLILAIIGLRRLWKKNPLLLLLLLSPLLPTFIAASVRAYPYGGSARTSLYMAPAFCLLAGLGAHVLIQQVACLMSARNRPAPGDPRPAPRGAGIRVVEGIVCAVLLGFALFTATTDFAFPYKSQSIKTSHDAARDLARKVGPGDRWVMFNAVEKVDYAPYLGDWWGVGGQFVFDILRFSPTKIEWAPPPQMVQRPSSGALWVVAYRVQSDKAKFPDEQWNAYRAALNVHGIAPEFQRYEIKNEKNGQKYEAVDVYRYGGP